MHERRYGSNTNEITGHGFDAAQKDVHILFALGFVQVKVRSCRFNVLTTIRKFTVSVIPLICIIKDKVV